MSDLISRSELIKELNKYCGNQRYLVSENIREIINNQPNAYSVEKVVEELEMEMKASSCYSAERVSAFSRAIEIVKQEAEQYNNGWIPCIEQSPEEDEKVYISTKTERVYVGVYTKRYGFEKREGFICDDGFMWMNTALAWKPYVLPAPYQPKGE